ncbi:hypothetical protein K7432_011976 [Basidiobolus ranarum]|uniref:DUF6924 domain-containing protein n=1 Tax=Basidiobolus ranarum TaxID=34480 RepID=A0ABR2WLI9_9FUNG
MSDDIICFRTDYTDDEKWNFLKKKTDEGEYACNLVFREGDKYKNKGTDELFKCYKPLDEEPYFFVIGDSKTMSDNIFVIADTRTKKTFRCRVETLWEPVCNLHVGTLDIKYFEEHLVGDVYEPED